jgi:hypothetical protein
MTKFMLLYSGGGMPEEEEERNAIMAQWMAWYGAAGDAVVDAGNPFGASSSVTGDGVSDGPVSSPPSTGYTIISADSLEAAVALTKDHPHVTLGGQVTVYETFDVM